MGAMCDARGALSAFSLAKEQNFSARRFVLLLDFGLHFSARDCTPLIQSLHLVCLHFGLHFSARDCTPNTLALAPVPTGPRC